jgi:type IV pilus assembly protein PilE
MRRMFGFTLIEMMIAVAVIGILAMIAFPSYENYMRRAIRSQGQQFLMDLAQREEQFLLDQRAYTATLGTGGLGMAVPTDVAANYQTPVIVADSSASPPTYLITLTPIAGGRMVTDGVLVINNLQQRWRETDGNTTFGANDCRWENTSCQPS